MDTGSIFCYGLFRNDLGKFTEYSESGNFSDNRGRKVAFKRMGNMMVLDDALGTRMSTPLPFGYLFSFFDAKKFGETYERRWRLDNWMERTDIVPTTRYKFSPIYVAVNAVNFKRTFELEVPKGQVLVIFKLKPELEINEETDKFIRDMIGNGKGKYAVMKGENLVGYAFFREKTEDEMLKWSVSYKCVNVAVVSADTIEDAFREAVKIAPQGATEIKVEKLK